MGQKKSFTYTKFAFEIAKHVNSVEEVDLKPRGPGSLFEKVRNDFGGRL